MSLFPSTLHWLMPKMRRQTLIHLLLTWLLLAASQHSYSSNIKVQARESVHFKFRPAQQSSTSCAEYVLTDQIKTKKQVEVKKIHRTPPSGPNPVGNQHPPTRP